MAGPAVLIRPIGSKIRCWPCILHIFILHFLPSRRLHILPSWPALYFAVMAGFIFYRHGQFTFCRHHRLYILPPWPVHIFPSWPVYILPSWPVIFYRHAGFIFYRHGRAKSRPPVVTPCHFKWQGQAPHGPPPSRPPSGLTRESTQPSPSHVC